ncbi:MAG: TIM barrel protein [Oscillospiraceae bacterium]|nr:TIM barrel protein [Oscillospiraceae bacterium]
MSYAKFGPAGNSDSFDERYKEFSKIPKYVSEMNLDFYEYQFGRGVRMQTKSAETLKAEAKAYDITLTAHAPYYITLSSEDETKRIGSIRYFIETAKAVTEMGGNRIIVHSGSVGKRSRAQALKLACDTMGMAIDKLDEAGYSDVIVCPETMGKVGQLGDLDEVLTLCMVDERIIPCIDFGHLNARTNGGIKGEDDYKSILQQMENAIGNERIKQFHSHFSKIEYTAGGEKRHLTFSDRLFGPDPAPLMKLIAKLNLHPYIVCESDGTQAEDAFSMKQMYLQNI